MQQDSSSLSLWDALHGSPSLSDRFLCGAHATVELGELAGGSSLGGRIEELRDRSVLIATTDQLTAALALIELDGAARRLVLCPSDLSSGQLSAVIHAGDINAIVSDAIIPGLDIPIACSSKIEPADTSRRASHLTEWVLLTSGTTGLPKLVSHTLSSLTGAIKGNGAASNRPVWSTFYDIRRYGGLQIFLRALLCGGSLVLSSHEESTAQFLARVALHGVTHISGTPSHWRRALMSPAASSIAPQYVRLSGEIADQAILDHLRAFYPHAKVGHAFASTEAGVGFEVNDGLAGFPAEFVGRPDGDVELNVVDGSLCIRSTRVASSYLAHEGRSLQDLDGFVDTGDMLELRGDRYYFVGRRDGTINVGGLKVHPEEVEAVINRHPMVRMSLVRTRKSPITGALVVADVVLLADPHPLNGHARELQQEILQLCRSTLPSHKVPAAINIVSALTVAPNGKMARTHA